MARLKALYTENKLAMLQLHGEMERINRRFAGDGIRSLFLNGPVLAAMLYGAVSDRASCNLNILVARQDWNASERQLVAAGYIRGESYNESAEVLGSTERKAHHVSYFHPQKNVKVELHYNLHPGMVKEPIFEELWVRRQASELDKSIFTLGNEDMLVYLILYGTRHGWTSISSLIDIDRMLDQFLNWNRAHQLFEESDSFGLGGKAFVLSTQLLGTLLPEEAYAITKHPKAYMLAQMAIPFIREEVVLYPKPERREIEAKIQPLFTCNNELQAEGALYFKQAVKNMVLLLWFWRQVKRQTI